MYGQGNAWIRVPFEPYNGVSSPYNRVRLLRRSVHSSQKGCGLWNPDPYSRPKNPNAIGLMVRQTRFELGIFGQTIAHGIFVYMQNCQWLFWRALRYSLKVWRKMHFFLNSKKNTMEIGWDWNGQHCPSHEMWLCLRVVIGCDDDEIVCVDRRWRDRDACCETRRGYEWRGIEDGMMLVLQASESLFYNGASFIYRNRSTLYVIRQDIGVGGLMRLR